MVALLAKKVTFPEMKAKPNSGFKMFNFLSKPDKKLSSDSERTLVESDGSFISSKSSSALKAKHSKRSLKDIKPKQNLQFAEEPVVIENPIKTLTEEEHIACFLTNEEKECSEKERLLVAVKYNRHKRNPARTKFDDDVDGPMRGLEEVFDVFTIQKCKDLRKHHVTTVLDEQKRIESINNMPSDKKAELLATASKKVSKKYVADAHARGKLDAAASDRTKINSLW